MNESKRLPLLCNSPNARTPASISSPAVSAKYTLWILSLCHSVNGQNTLVAAARLRCGILENDERKRCTLKKKGCQEVNQRVLREALAECVQRQGESRLPSLPILEGSLNTRVPPHPRSHVPRVGKERWRNKLPGARSKWSQQHRKKKKKIKRWIGKREAFTVWCTADAHCAASAATWDGTSPSRRAAWH